MTDKNLRIAILPVDVAWGDVKENLYQVNRAVASLPDFTDIVVLPELFSTGYTSDTMQLAALAERSDGPTMQAIKDLSVRTKAAFAGSFLATDGYGEYYNRAFFVEPSGDVTFYDKHHLFAPSGEAATFTAGNRMPPIVRFRGWNVALIVCYDLRFPVWCANRPPLYDLLLVPANWGKSRQYAWQHLLMARAIENQAYVAGANRSGRDDFGEYSGMSAIYDTMGKPLAVESADSPWVTAELSGDDLQKMRRRIPSLDVADDFSVRL